MMKRKMIPPLAICCMLLFSACSAGKPPIPVQSQASAKQSQAPSEQAQMEQNQVSGDQDGPYRKITAKEAKEMMDKGGVTVVDVRSKEEYEQAHIPDALLVPVETIGGQPPEQLPDKDGVVLVHCRTGVRSKAASDKLVELGYKHVYDFGGIVDWPYETEKGDAAN